MQLSYGKLRGRDETFFNSRVSFVVGNRRRMKFWMEVWGQALMCVFPLFMCLCLVKIGLGDRCMG